jgi:ribosomal protein S18 acetylase RimI-like enzyme
MMAALFPGINAPDPIRKLDLTRDLDQVADLIELCFPIHQDPDGQTYVNEMRKTARDLRRMGWLSPLTNVASTTTAGFVWEENGQIIGNLSLIPLQKEGRRVHLIANVAVHPNQRGRGIGKKLTQRALNHLKSHRESQVWLQVRDDNPAAINLYRSLDFSDQAARTTWRIRPSDYAGRSISLPTELSLRRRKPDDWEAQKLWLAEAYPPHIRWNLPVNFRRFTPGLIQSLTNFLDGAFLKHWSIAHGGRCQGVITWQKSDSYANNLWLAFPTGLEGDLLTPGLAHVLKRSPKNHPLSIDYPKGKCDLQFESLGFKKFRTLIWMWRRV